tara:strand:+ start:2334 stop:2735 length:402 start_codon:yes stop_codon:yes gene_type:complete
MPDNYEVLKPKRKGGKTLVVRPNTKKDKKKDKRMEKKRQDMERIKANERKFKQQEARRKGEAPMPKPRKRAITQAKPNRNERIRKNLVNFYKKERQEKADMERALYMIAQEFKVEEAKIFGRKFKAKPRIPRK